MARDARATLLFESKLVLSDGLILQARIWAVPTPVAGSRHGLTYSLFLRRAGERMVLYDHERPKGDHRHDGDREERYEFETVEKLVEDFMADVARVIGPLRTVPPGGA